MADPASVGVDDSFPALGEAASTAIDVILNPHRKYMLVHTGMKADGTAETGYVMASVEAATPANSTGDKKFMLISTKSLFIGPGCTLLSLKASANTVGINIIPFGLEM